MIYPAQWVVVREEDTYGNKLTILATVATEQEAKRLVRRLRESYIRRGDWSSTLRFDACRRLGGTIMSLDWMVYRSVQSRRAYQSLQMYGE